MLRALWSPSYLSGLRHICTGQSSSARSRPLRSGKVARKECRRAPRCDCQKRERRDNELAAKGKLPVVQRLQEEPLKKRSLVEKKSLYLEPASFPENYRRPNISDKSCRMATCDCRTKEDRDNRLAKGGRLRVTKRLQEEMPPSLFKEGDNMRDSTSSTTKDKPS